MSKKRPAREAKDPEPLWKQIIHQWGDARREDFEERAAIKEYLAGMTRAEAEKSAFDELATRS